MLLARCIIPFPTLVPTLQTQSVYSCWMVGKKKRQWGTPNKSSEWFWSVVHTKWKRQQIGWDEREIWLLVPSIRPRKWPSRADPSTLKQLVEVMCFFRLSGGATCPAPLWCACRSSELSDCPSANWTSPSFSTSWRSIIRRWSTLIIPSKTCMEWIESRWTHDGTH